MSEAFPKLREQPSAEAMPALSDAQLRQVERRRSIVAAWRAMCREFTANDRTKGEASKLFLETHPGVSERTLYDWSRRYDSGGLAELLDGRSTSSRCPPGEVSPAAWQRFKELWLTIQGRSVALCWRTVNNEAKAKGWIWPGQQTIRRKIALELPPLKADYFRLGEREWSRRWGPKMRRDFSQYRSNQVHVGDFHQCDVFCRKSQADWTITRPLLCAWLDLRSRIIPGFRIVEREDQNAILLTFRDGVAKWGAPDEVIIDNGKPYRAYGVSGGRPTRRRIVEDEDYVRSVFGQLEVIVHFSLPYNPDSKPIERWFRTLEEQFGVWAESYCGGDNKAPRWKAAEKLAREHPEQCPTVAEFGEKLGNYIEKVYHVTPHTGDGMEGLSPAQAFERFDPIAKKTAPDGVLDLLMMRLTRPVKVTRFGVRYQGIEYGQNDTQLFLLQGKDVLLRVDPQDASFVIVCDLVGLPICRATNNSLALCGVTQDHVAEGMKAKARARRLVRAVHEGGTRAALQTVADAAIMASLNRPKPRESRKATGTDGPVPRNVRPVRAWMREAFEKSKPGPPADDIGPVSFAEMERAAEVNRFDLLERIAAIDDDDRPEPEPSQVPSWDDLRLALEPTPEAKPLMAVAALHRWCKRKVEK